MDDASMERGLDDRRVHPRVAIECCGLAGPIQGVRRVGSEDLQPPPVIVKVDTDGSVGQFMNKLREQLGRDARSTAEWCALRTFTFGTRVYEFDDPNMKFMLTQPIRGMWMAQVPAADDDDDDDDWAHPVIICNIYLYADQDAYDEAKRERERSGSLIHCGLGRRP